MCWGFEWDQEKYTQLSFAAVLFERRKAPVSAFVLSNFVFLGMHKFSSEELNVRVCWG